MKKCENCKYFDGRNCVVPIWADGQKYEGQVTDPERVCDLHETLVTVEE